LTEREQAEKKKEDEAKATQDDKDREMLYKEAAKEREERDKEAKAKEEKERKEREAAEKKKREERDRVLNMYDPAWQALRREAARAAYKRGEKKIPSFEEMISHELPKGITLVESLRSTPSHRSDSFAKNYEKRTGFIYDPFGEQIHLPRQYFIYDPSNSNPKLISNNNKVGPYSDRENLESFYPELRESRLAFEKQLEIEFALMWRPLHEKVADVVVVPAKAIVVGGKMVGKGAIVVGKAVGRGAKAVGRAVKNTVVSSFKTASHGLSGACSQIKGWFSRSKPAPPPPVAPPAIEPPTPQINEQEATRQIEQFVRDPLSQVVPDAAQKTLIQETNNWLVAQGTIPSVPPPPAAASDSLTQALVPSSTPVHTPATPPAPSTLGVAASNPFKLDEDECVRQFKAHLKDPLARALPDVARHDLVRDTYSWLAVHGKNASSTDVQNNIAAAVALQNMLEFKRPMQFDLQQHEDYEQFMSAVVDTAIADISSNDPSKIERGLGFADFCDSRAALEVLQPKPFELPPLIAKDSPIERYVRRTKELAIERGVEIVKHPLPVVGTVVGTAVLGAVSAPALATAGGVMLMLKAEEIAAYVDEMWRLLKEDTPEAMAQLTMLVGEMVVFHKAVKAATPPSQAAVARCKKAIDAFALKVKNELESAVLTGTVSTPNADAVRNAAKTLLQEEEAALARALAASRSEFLLVEKNGLSYWTDIPDYGLDTKTGLFKTAAYELETGVCARDSLKAINPKQRTVNFTSHAKMTKADFEAFVKSLLPEAKKVPYLSRDGKVVLGEKYVADTVIEGRRIITTVGFRNPSTKPDTGQVMGNVEKFILEQDATLPVPADTTEKFSWKSNMHIIILE
jgi:flagellar biosynthesis GTPase FlhF